LGPPLLSGLVGGAAGFWAGPGIGLTAAAAFLVVTAVLAVLAQAVILVVARASPRRRLLADVTPAYVASLTLRPYQLDGRSAWYAANYTAWPRGYRHGAQLRDRVSRLAAAEHRPGASPSRPNWGAGRDLRMLKVALDEITGGHRNEKVAQGHLDIRSYVETGRKHGENRFSLIERLVRRNPWMIPTQAAAPVAA
jgi:hypothetical protein